MPIPDGTPPTEGPDAMRSSARRRSRPLRLGVRGGSTSCPDDAEELGLVDSAADPKGIEGDLASHLVDQPGRHIHRLRRLAQTKRGGVQHQAGRGDLVAPSNPLKTGASLYRKAAGNVMHLTGNEAPPQHPQAKARRSKARPALKTRLSASPPLPPIPSGTANPPLAPLPRSLSSSVRRGRKARGEIRNALRGRRAAQSAAALCRSKSITFPNGLVDRRQPSVFVLPVSFSSSGSTDSATRLP